MKKRASAIRRAFPVVLMEAPFHPIYRGTSWDDRPEVSEILERLGTGSYESESPKRLRQEAP